MNETTADAAATPTTGLGRHRLLLGLAGGTLVLGLVAGAGTGFALDGRTAASPPTATGALVQGASFFPPEASRTTRGGATQAQTPAVAASADQQVGVVTIDTVLGYQGAAAAGTGMILTSDGLILTNNHVVEGSTDITVTDETTGQTYAATVVGTDATHDVALLQLQDASDLQTVALDDDNGVTTGETVTAIGNAEGTGSLVAATGTVLATEQSMTASSDASGSNSETLDGLIEFAAAVVGGDSGGALVDDEGEVVGMTTAASTSQSSVVAYAISIEDALAIAIQIEQGVDNADIVLGYPAFLGVSLSSDGSATLAGVLQGTPAAAAGLTAGDTVTSVDGVAVSTASELSAALGAHEPGDAVALTWVSGATGASSSASATLIEGPAA
ncbi:S1C family serine protease [Cellulomonas sp. URHE0023]|uniref:S1C family serine protease n=1 Tax=Cellulomonas sp. URHE0023 TaxID=1380354 RepID=UPI00068E61F6|nr:trypsin-like peptidase domain-containing protein [Cellulomonas sp. URHE0023]